MIQPAPRRVRFSRATRHLFNTWWPFLLIVAACTVGFLITLPHPLYF